MLRIFYYLFFIIIIFYFTNSLSIETEWSNGKESQVRIISPYTTNNNQDEIFLGLHYKLEDGWKTYWRSPGEGGFPQEINWQLSENVKNLEILWPIPKYFKILGFTSIGYDHEVIFPLKILIDDKNKQTSIVFDLNYLVCKNICIPGKAYLELTIPPGKGKITEHYFYIQKFLSSVPKTSLKYSKLKNFEVQTFENKENISIIVSVESETIIQNPLIFLHSEFGLPVVKPKIMYSPNAKKIDAKFDFDKKNILKDKFVLNSVFQDNNKVFESINQLEVKKFSRVSILNNSLIYILIVSVLGGMILNVMPCVLPVLSIKILSVIKQSENKLSIRKSFLVSSLGILTSFALLAIVLICVRSFGISIGWGMQFQQPLFLIIIGIILFLFSLNTFGVFEINTPGFVNSLKIQKLSRNKYSNDFFNGFLATILATPCSAPFVGTAITAAFTQSSYTMFGIFIAMGIGMTSPYIFLALFPNLTNFLPKPGPWMTYIRYFLGILLFGTFIWILSILMSHFSFSSNSKLTKDSNWIDFTTINLEDIKKQNNIIFVDITADWCVTCQFNKINVLQSDSIKNAFIEYNVLKIRGDWTKSNNKIEIFLEENNRFGVPLNVVFSKSYPDGISLSELLTEEEILKTLIKIQQY